MSLIIIALTIFSSFKPFEYYFVRARIPAEWKKARTTMQNSVLYEKENKDVVLLSFGKEHYYFKYPTLISVFPGKNVTRNDVERFVKNVFVNTILSQSERDRKKSWKFLGMKSTKSVRGYEINYYAFSGKATRPVSQYIPIAAQVVVVKGRKGAVMLSSGFAIENVSAHNKKELASIQNGFVSHMNDVLKVANNVEFVHLKKDNAFKKLLIRKKHFRHESSFSSGFTTGMYSNSVAGHRKIYFDFYKDGTCRFIDNGVVSGMFSTSYNGKNLQSGHSSNLKGNANWSIKVPFDVYLGKKSEYLVVHFSEGKGGDRVFSINKNGREKCGKKTIHGIAIEGKVEGYFLTQSGICTYKK